VQLTLPQRRYDLWKKICRNCGMACDVEVSFVNKILMIVGQLDKHDHTDTSRLLPATDLCDVSCPLDIG